MKKKLFVFALASAAIMALAACGQGGQNQATVTATPTPRAEVTATPTTAPVAETKTATLDGAVNFGDGNYGFIQLYMNNSHSDASTLELIDYNGSKALMVNRVEYKDDAKTVTFLGIDIASLLGAKVSDVAKVSLLVGSAHDDDKFYAISGKIGGWFTAEDGSRVDQVNGEWSIFLERQNPKVITWSVPEGYAFTANDLLMLTYADDVANNSYITDKEKRIGGSLIIDAIRFEDKDGNEITADTTVAFAGPADFAPEVKAADYSHLYVCANPVEFKDFNVSGGAWSQAGLEMPEEIVNALVPGSVIEIEYESADGSMWIVMPWATVGWSRVCSDDSAYINGAKNIAQITYEQIAAVCGEDKSTWGAMLQCEAKSDWEVYSLKVGTKKDQPFVASAVEFADFKCDGGAWSQAGFTIPDEVRAALVPGSVVEIDFESEDGTMWIVLPDAENGWSRICDSGALIFNGKCYITYEEMAAVCGEDTSKWGGRLQCEAKTAWEVTGVRVGKLSKVPASNSIVEFPEFKCDGGAWSQAGFAIPDEVRAALVPGSVIEIDYTSEDGTMWIVLPDANNGWSRICDSGAMTVGASKCYITYEEMAAVCGEDTSAWGGRLQCEAKTAWEVTGVRVLK